MLHSRSASSKPSKNFDTSPTCTPEVRFIATALALGMTAAEVKADGEPRNHQYAWIGAFIAKRSQVLIAIWDGAPARLMRLGQRFSANSLIDNARGCTLAAPFKL